MAEKKRIRTKRKERKSIPRGRVYIHSTFNNTLITFTDPNGNVIAWGSSGASGFKGSRKGTPYGAQKAAEAATKKVMEQGMRQVDAYVKGAGSGREAALRALQGAGMNITGIRDVTPIPHNGCRPPKRRRL